MKKCTLCVDRIYNENLPEEDRVPACVRACPAEARHFGDLADPDSAVSKLVAERGGVDLMPEQGTKPVNKYLPPPRRRISTARHADRPRRHGNESPPRATGFLELARPGAGPSSADRRDRSTQMHPAPFRSSSSPRLSGAGYGLWVLIAISLGFGLGRQLRRGALARQRSSRFALAGILP
jgi:hypothetical protein